MRNSIVGTYLQAVSDLRGASKIHIITRKNKENNFSKKNALLEFVNYTEYGSVKKNPS